MSTTVGTNGKGGAKWGRVWRYEGTRAVVWRIRYRDSSGRRVMETLGKEPAWSRKRAEQELRRRLVDVEREGYVAPERVTLGGSANAGSPSTCRGAGSS
jgi:hypothetical protein